MVKRIGFSCAAANEAKRRTLATNEINALALAIEAPSCRTNQRKDDQPQNQRAEYSRHECLLTLQLFHTYLRMLWSFILNQSLSLRHTNFGLSFVPQEFFN